MVAIASAVDGHGNRRRPQQLVRARVHRARRRRFGTAISADAYDRGKASGQLARSRNGRHGHQHRNGWRRVRPCGAHDSCQRPCRGPLSDASLLVSAYFNGPSVLYVNAGSAPALLGIARGAMDCFMQTLPTRGAVTYTAASKAAELRRTPPVGQGAVPLKAAECSPANSAHCIAESFKGHQRSWSGRGPCLHRPQSLACPGPVSISYSRPAVRLAHPAYRRHSAVLPRYQRAASACGHTAQQRRRGLRPCAGGS